MTPIKMVEVTQEDANKYCEVLRALGMVEADWEFSDAMIGVLAPHSYLTEYIQFNFPQVGIEEAQQLRLLWAEHIARSIYEQIGA